MSVDHTHPDMSEVKKVRVEKTLDVPVGEVVPLAKTSRSAVSSSTARESVMVGSDTRGDPERGSPFNETMSRRQYDKSPIRDRRSLPHAQRSPEVVEPPSFRNTSPNPMRDTMRHLPYRYHATFATQLPYINKR